MTHLLDIPELRGLDQRQQLVRIPPELDVPLTPRVKRLIDTAEFRRLAHISQLGLVALVYPAANHTRFEHSLGVYRMALVYVKQLASLPAFQAQITAHDAEVLVVAALLHDLGHWPFCHPIEDIRLSGVPEHEELAESYLRNSALSTVLKHEWQIDPHEVVALLAEPPQSARDRLLQSILSGPIDIDKMDYLTRDSLHAGVPYGRNFDQQRLVGSLCLNATSDGLAILDKGRTAAEMMVFARYVMFSEVYWHHAVRSATAMLQRAFYLLYPRLDLDKLFRLPEWPWIERLREEAGRGPAGELLDGLFGSTRCLYKRCAQFSFFQERELYERLARRPYTWLAACTEQVALQLSRALDQEIQPHEVLLDAPPVKREVEFQVDVFFAKENCYRPFREVSPVIQTLAERQFDDFVKRVRLFIHPRHAAACQTLADLPTLMHRAVDATPA